MHSHQNKYTKAPRQGKDQGQTRRPCRIFKVMQIICVKNVFAQNLKKYSINIASPNSVQGFIWARTRPSSDLCGLVMYEVTQVVLPKIVSLQYLNKYLTLSNEIWYTEAPAKARQRSSSNLVTFTLFSRSKRFLRCFLLNVRRNI